MNASPDVGRMRQTFRLASNQSDGSSNPLDGLTTFLWSFLSQPYGLAIAGAVVLALVVGGGGSEDRITIN